MINTPHATGTTLGDAVVLQLSVERTSADLEDVGGAFAVATGQLQGVQNVQRNGDQVIVAGNGPILAKVAARLAQDDQAPMDLRQDQATLEQVFLSLTGREIRA